MLVDNAVVLQRQFVSMTLIKFELCIHCAKFFHLFHFIICLSLSSFKNVSGSVKGDCVGIDNLIFASFL